MLAGLDDVRDALDDSLVQASRFTLPDALLPFVADELVDAADGWFSLFDASARQSPRSAPGSKRRAQRFPAKFSAKPRDSPSRAT